MAKERKPKLKVFRTAIGFHDAYVAAPSQKAALEVWGSDSNLFGQGLAEQVVDPELTEAPLAAPGQVIRRTRGSAKEQLAALGDMPKRRQRLNRAKLAAAEQAMAELEAKQQEERRALEKEMEALRSRRRALDRTHEAALRKAAARVERPSRR